MTWYRYLSILEIQRCFDWYLFVDGIYMSDKDFITTMLGPHLLVKYTDLSLSVTNVDIDYFFFLPQIQNQSVSWLFAMFKLVLL